MGELNNGDVTDVLDSFFFDYAINDDVDAVNTRELIQQCSDMNKAVNEWYAKAKAFDELYKQVKGIEKELFGTGKPIVPQKDAFARLGIVVSDLIYDEYESGESDGL